jgi:hypothetical protein
MNKIQKKLKNRVLKIQQEKKINYLHLELKYQNLNKKMKNLKNYSIKKRNLIK